MPKILLADQLCQVQDVPLKRSHNLWATSLAHSTLPQLFLETPMFDKNFE